MAYPIFFIVAWMCSSSFRIYELASNDRSSGVWQFFAIMDALFVRVQGALNVLVYVLAPIDTTGNILCCGTRKKTEEEEPLHTNTSPNVAEQF